MTNDVEKRIRELKTEVANLNESILWSAADLKAAVIRSSPRNSNEFLLGSMLDIESKTKFELYKIDMDLRVYFATLHDDLVAIAKKSDTSAELIQASVSESNGRLENALTQISPKDLIKSLAPKEEKGGNTPIAGMSMGGLIPPSLLGKIELVLDAVAGFLKAWSSPFNVGIALAIPILAGIVPLVYMVVEAIHAIAKPLENITAPFAALGKLIAGDDDEETIIEESAGKEISKSLEFGFNIIQTGFFALEDSLDEIEGQMALITKELENPKERKVTIGIDIDPIVEAVDDFTDRFARMMGANFQKKKETALKPSMTEFETEVLAFLSNPIKVSIEKSAPDPQKEDTTTVFADAVTPLMNSQLALYNMLESNLKKLSEDLHTLKETPRKEDASHRSVLNDTMNISLNPNTEYMILTETKDIRGLLDRVRNELTNWKNMWMTYTKSSEKDKEGTGKKSGD